MKQLQATLTLLFVLSTGQATAQDAAAPAAPTPTATVSLEAAIVYSMGGPQPIAREDFLLLSRDPVEIAIETEMVKREMSSATQGDRMLYLLGVWKVIGQVPPNADKGTLKYAASVRKKDRLERVDAFDGLLKASTVATVKSGFDGKATFAAVPPGTYWIYGTTTVRSGGGALWVLRIDVPAGGITAVLSQDNAIKVQ